MSPRLQVRVPPARPSVDVIIGTALVILARLPCILHSKLLQLPPPCRGGPVITAAFHRCRCLSRSESAIQKGVGTAPSIPSSQLWGNTVLSSATDAVVLMVIVRNIIFVIHISLTSWPQMQFFATPDPSSQTGQLADSFRLTLNRLFFFFFFF
ncbi:hypothetical protein BX600DRAFT_258950 [Xylariales sp. PMI_506]|nr:hypothetical protein BX600DRAFT_258950 [Xylariales sp. PMI_506]